MNSIFTVPFFSILTALGRSGQRPDRWTVRTVVVTSVLMALSEARSLQARFDEARRCLGEMFPGRKRPGGTYQGYVKARRKLTGKQMRVLKRRLRRHHRRTARDCWRHEGWLAFSVDGTRVEVPRTAANEQALGCAGRKKSGPQLSLTALVHLGTGLPWAWRIGAGTQSEQVHLRRLRMFLPAGSLLVADAGFTGYELLKSLMDRGVHFLVRMGSNRTLLKGLADAGVTTDGQIVWFWPQGRQSGGPPLMLRLIRVEQPNRSPMVLVTDVMDAPSLTNRQIEEFYRRRWGHEVFYRAFKRTLGHHKLRSGSPAEARQELEWAMVAYQTLGLLSVEGMIRNGQDPRHWSPARALRILRQGMTDLGTFRRKGDLRGQLQEAVKDRYARTGSKTARNWPHKKNDRPPGVPKIREAQAEEKQKAKRSYGKKVAA